MEEQRQPSSQSNVLHELIKGFKFNKVNSGLLILPTVFAFLSAVLITVGLGQILKAGTGVLPLTEGMIPLEVIYSYQLILWGTISMFGFAMASMIATYVLLRDLRDHFYQSGIVTYYFTGGASFESALQYLKSTLARSTLPSSATGLVLVLLTSGLAYPILLCFAEKSIREHAAIEEEVLFKTRLTGSYSWIRSLLDIALVVASMGLYLAYMGYRIAKVYNAHINTVHGTHPNPPAPPATARIQELGVSAKLLVGVFLLVISLGVLVSYLGLITPGYVALPSGMLLGALVSLRRRCSSLSNVPLVFSLLYLLVMGGFLAGLVGYETHRYLAEVFERQVGTIRHFNVLELATYIFTNNLVVSLPSIIPYIGSILVTNGGFNAGVVLGVFASNLGRTSEALLVLFYPHALLELLSYAILITSASYIGMWRKYTKVVIAGGVLLLAAAFVEAITISWFR